MANLPDFLATIFMGALTLFGMGVLIAAFLSPIAFVAWLFFG